MNKSIIKIRRILEHKRSITPKKCLNQLTSIVDEYRESVKGKFQLHEGWTLIDRALDPTLSMKQDQAVNDKSDEDDE